MTLHQRPGHDDIVARLKTIQGVDVMEGEYANDSYQPPLDTTTKMFPPYLLVKFNGGFPTYDNGIVGYDKDTQRTTFSVYVVSPSDRVTRDFVDKVRVALMVDFRPRDGSALRPTGGYSFADADLGYNRYVHNIGFAYLTNLS